MIYLNYFFFYSLLGFIMESTLYKITVVNMHSGILYGPYTLVYGFGVLTSILIYEFLESRVKWKNKFIKVLCYFLLYTIVLSLIEFIGGHILHFFFQIDLWNYSNHIDAIGKYICFTNSLIWGLLGTLNVYFIYPRLKKLFKKIPKVYTYSILGILILDIILTIITKILF